jgi:hypothetical protein
MVLLRRTPRSCVAVAATMPWVLCHIMLRLSIHGLVTKRSYAVVRYIRIRMGWVGGLLAGVSRVSTAQRVAPQPPAGCSRHDGATALRHGMQGLFADFIPDEIMTATVIRQSGTLTGRLDVHGSLCQEL